MTCLRFWPVQVWPSKYGGGREGVGRLVSSITELLLVPLNAPSECLRLGFW